ncbi:MULTISPECIES: hypothetical protein [unclassified Actinobaculum]|uniref:hypothetical protein n=1 Tax=unclassified Actinobaculum TaxID=2609299 RepID=UPI000D527702|nr:MULTISPECIES: hypothetical protein [unclassified Actinobaculum]AWE41610.1 hypothetical protein DDD63_01230 [Actinobaculum sp. 313]RTE49230.1 hypothetical protein EKN07_06560 [Actinobaculum sp. 352]
MSTPTDPYSSSSRRPFEDDDILAPIDDATSDTRETSSQDASASAEENSESAIQGTSAEHNAQASTSMTPETPNGDPNVHPAPDGSQTAADSALAEDLAAATSPVEDTLQDAAVEDASVEPEEYTGPVESGDTVTSEPRTATDEQPLTDSDASAETATSPLDLPLRSASPDAAHASLAEAIGMASEHEERNADDDTEATGPAVADAPQESGDKALPTDWATPPPDPDTVPAAPKSRAWTHTGALAATIVLAPVAWYLLSDASVRLSLVDGNPWATGHLNIAALLELLGGIAVATLIALLARASSLGVTVAGVILSLFGCLALVLPRWTQGSIIDTLDTAIGDINPLCGNIVHHLGLDLGSGRMLMFGAALMLAGVISHGARRRGQRFGIVTTRRHIALGDSES